jgi:hypothetical protein
MRMRRRMNRRACACCSGRKLVLHYTRAEVTAVEGVKGKKVRTTSNDAGEKPASEKSKSTVGKCE